jgi:hypothetical protein
MLWPAHLWLGWLQPLGANGPDYLPNLLFPLFRILVLEFRI